MRTLFVVVFVVIVGIIFFNITSYVHTSTVTATVTGKERITQKSGDNIESFYLVYTDKGTMKLEDDVLRGNWYSSDVYGRLKNDSTYTFTVSGYRFGFFSMYPNIIEVKIQNKEYMNKLKFELNMKKEMTSDHVVWPTP